MAQATPGPGAAKVKVFGRRDQKKLTCANRWSLRLDKELEAHRSCR
jgi:hypothetical protein